jgi:hypothetical protein
MVVAMEVLKTWARRLTDCSPVCAAQARGCLSRHRWQ